MKEPQKQQIMNRLQKKVQLKKTPDEKLAIQTMTTTRLMARSGVNSETIRDAITQALKEKNTASKLKQMQLALKGVSNKKYANQLISKMTLDQGQGKQSNDLSGSGSGGNGSSGK